MNAPSNASNSQGPTLGPLHKTAILKLTLATLCLAMLVLIVGTVLDRSWPTPGSNSFATTLGLVLLAVLGVRHAYLTGVRNAEKRDKL